MSSSLLFCKGEKESGLIAKFIDFAHIYKMGTGCEHDGKIMRDSNTLKGVQSVYKFLE